MLDRLRHKAERTDAPFLVPHAAKRPLERHRQEVDKSLIELGERTVVTPIANHPPWERELAVPERLGEDVLDGLEPTVPSSTEETTAVRCRLGEVADTTDGEFPSSPPLSEFP